MRGCVIFLLTLCCHLRGFSQSNLDGSIELRIERDSFEVSVDHPQVEIELSCKNLGDTNLLLYGIVGNVTRVGGADQICDIEKTGGGLAVLILNGRNERIRSTRGPFDSIHNAPMTTERFVSLMRESRAKYLSNLKTVKGGGVLSVREQIDLKNYGLKKGVYRLQVTYYSGRRLLTTRVGEDQIEKDKKFHSAELYQGCAQSNFVSLIVN